MASWDEWSDRYEVAFVAVPGDPHQPCPECGHDALRLVFTGDLETAVGYASFWCDHCLNGISISRVPIPPGAVVRSIHDAPEDRRPVIPNFRLVI
ncbi:hypothetical protein I0C86_14030 [Plantactinospora sp. S1510]|uniref:Small CPxCG-related zinc finger protein n=1 Tax=Plantactinospora alkalitolerans TaxID=2789879 RepID=A0ABS0GV44_9ACTN|nr:hypothetical protein [Plantactinospora alkalitolerans]MBF9130056.1 hypothetical protein [Plantactinospora alkalitolerans]MBF9130068.1 hypothetical protein [Plantactinospora alkalitolerans]